MGDEEVGEIRFLTIDGNLTTTTAPIVLSCQPEKRRVCRVNMCFAAEMRASCSDIAKGTHGISFLRRTSHLPYKGLALRNRECACADSLGAHVDLLDLGTQPARIRIQSRVPYPCLWYDVRRKPLTRSAANINPINKIECLLAHALADS